MRILFIGDVIGEPGIDFLRQHLFSYRKMNQVDFCVANGENSASGGKGVSKKSAQGLFDCGVDVITTGNHCFSCGNDITAVYENNSIPILRPANVHPSAPGIGYTILNTPLGNIAILNLLGRIYMQPAECPFLCADKILEEVAAQANIILVDFHAEATSEKLIMRRHLDGRVSAIVGTHTHVQTADDLVSDAGTAYITDLGMTGPIDSIIGIKAEGAHSRIVMQIPKRFEVADAPCRLNGVVVDINDNGRSTAIERVVLN